LCSPHDDGMAPEDSDSDEDKGEDGDGSTATLDLTDGGSVDWLARSREQMGVETEEDYRELREQGRKELVENAALASFAEGNVVDTPDGVGVVTDIMTEDTEKMAEGGDDINPSPSDPAYVVVFDDDRDGGESVFSESEIERSDSETDVNPPLDE